MQNTVLYLCNPTTAAWKKSFTKTETTLGYIELLGSNKMYLFYLKSK